MKKIFILIFPLSVWAGGMPEEIPVNHSALDAIIEKYCSAQVGFGEIIPAKEDRYVRAKELPDKYMIFSCAREVKLKYRHQQGITTIEALKFKNGHLKEILVKIEGTEEGVKTRELKRLYSKLEKLRGKILARP